MPQKPDWLRPHGEPWRRGPARPIYENPWISVTEYDATAPTGAPALYGLVGFKNLAIAVLPLHDDGTVSLVGQYRFSSGAYSWEIPEGSVVVAGSLPAKDGSHSLYAAIIVKQVDEKTRSKTGINELLRSGE